MLEIVVKNEFPNAKSYTNALKSYIQKHFAGHKDQIDLEKVYSALSTDIHRPKMPYEKLVVSQSDVNGNQYTVLEHMWKFFAQNDPSNPAGNFLKFE